MKRKLLFILIMFGTLIAFSQSTGDYRAKSGFIKNWGSSSSWETYNGSIWVAASDYPDNFTTQVTISAVTLKMIMNVDVEQSGGVLSLGKTLEVATGITFTYSGGNILNAPKLTVKGVIDYNRDGGTIPNASWQSTSTLNITGMVNTQPSLSSGDIYNNVNINSSSMAVEFDISNINYSGNLTISNTGLSNACIDDVFSKSSDFTVGTNGVFLVKDDGRVDLSGTFTNNAGVGGVVIETTTGGAGSFICNTIGVAGTFKQFVSSGQWHLLGIPVAQGAGATLAAFNPAGGDGYMRAYETVNSDWGDYMSTESTQLNVGQGYEYWTTVNNTVSVTGTFSTGNQNNTLLSSGNKYNLLSNPYPCAIDWETVSNSTNALSESIYFYSNTAGTNGYAVYNGSLNTGSYGATQYIPPFQGFFVEQTGGTAMNFTNSNKAHPNTAFYKSVKEEGVYDRIKLQIHQDTLWSECAIVYADGATNDYDLMYDTKMLTNAYMASPEVYSKVGEENIMINGIGSYPAVVTLELEIIEAGNIVLSLSEMSDIQDFTVVTLEDRETNSFYDLDENFSGISFDVEPGTISDRFFVHYSTTVGLEEQASEIASIYSNKNIIYIDHNSSEDFDIQVINMMGQTIYEDNKSGSGLVSVALDQPAAYYLVRLISEENTITKKLYIAK